MSRSSFVICAAVALTSFAVACGGTPPEEPTESTTEAFCHGGGGGGGGCVNDGSGCAAECSSCISAEENIRLMNADSCIDPGGGGGGGGGGACSPSVSYEKSRTAYSSDEQTAKANAGAAAEEAARQSCSASEGNFCRAVAGGSSWHSDGCNDLGIPGDESRYQCTATATVSCRYEWPHPW